MAQTTRFVIDPRNVLTQVLMETDGEGNPISYYVYGLGLISQEDADGAYHLYHFDSRGSTIALTNDKGEVTDTFAYGPYGELLTRTGSTHTNFLFNGQFGVITDDNGLYYMRARYYNPEIKRFINQDILLGNISDSSTFNRYAYVNGQPINLIDPFGLCGMEGLFGGMSDWIENNQKTIQFVAWGISIVSSSKRCSIVVDIILYGNSYVSIFSRKNVDRGICKSNNRHCLRSIAFWTWSKIRIRQAIVKGIGEATSIPLPI